MFLTVNPQNTQDFYQFGSHWHAAHFGFGCAGYDDEGDQVDDNGDQNRDQHADGRAFGDGKEAVVNNPGYDSHDGGCDQWFYVGVFELVAEVQVFADRKVIQYAHAQREQDSCEDNGIDVCLREDCEDQSQDDEVHSEGNGCVMQGFFLLADGLQDAVGDGGQGREYDRNGAHHQQFSGKAGA